MRGAAKYIWIFLIAAFVGGFLFYESSGLFGRSAITPSTAVATVNGQDILLTQWQRLSQQLEQQRTQATGKSVSLDERRILENQAYDQLVDAVLLQQEMKRRGIVVTDDELTNAARFSPPPQLMQDPELQTNGQFDLAKYQRFLTSPTAKQSGLLYQLEAYYRDAIPREKLYEQVSLGVYPSDALLWRQYQDQHQTATISYAMLRPSSEAIAAVKVTDAEVRAYYDAHKKEMERPGHGVVTVTQIPRVITAADTAAVLAHAQALRQRILNGEKFEDLAKTESSDAASAERGGDLGKGVKGRFVPQFESAAETLKPGEISEPVLTQFGYHLIRLDSRSGDTLALHHILLPITQSDSSADRTDRKADSLATVAGITDHPARFDSVVKTLGLKATRVNVTEGQPLVIDGHDIPSVSAWAFGAVKPGEISDLFDDDAGYYLARLESATKGGVPSLDAVKTDIRGLLAQQKAVQNEAEAARKLAVAAAASSLEQAGKLLNTPVAKAGPFTRIDGLRDLPSAYRVVGAAFALPVGQVGEPIVTDEAVYVIRVDDRSTVDRKEFDAQKDQQRGQAEAAMQRGRIQEFLANLRKAADITDRREDIQAAMRQTSS